jgi:hypothetical protein
MNDEHLRYFYNKSKRKEKVMSPPTCKFIPLHAYAVTNVVDPTSTSSHCSRLSSYDRHILSFVDVKAKECIEHVSDKEEDEMQDDRGSYGAFMHRSINPLYVLITLWAFICVSSFLLYFHLCPKPLVSKFSAMPPSIYL